MKHRILRVARSSTPLRAGLLLCLVSLVLAAPSPAAAVPASGDRALALEDILRLHSAGLSDDIIASEILVTETVFLLSTDELIRLKEAGLSDALIQFMVDTALEPAEDASAVDAADDGDTDIDRETYATLGWENEIATVESAPTYFVTLDYDYPDWWYHSYWDDYWYYDYHFYPYTYSYYWGYGAWYGGWYSYRNCYLPPYWGYRSRCYAGWGYQWNTRYCDSYYPSGAVYVAATGPSHSLSRTKYKTNGSSGKTLYADLGLKVRDPERSVRTLAHVDRKPIKSRNGGRVLVADVDRISADRVHRPVKSTKLTLHGERPITTGEPVKVDRRTPSVLDRRPTRTTTTRRPVLDKPPATRTRSVHTTVDKPRTPTPTVEKPRDDDRRTPPRVTSRPVRTSPPPAETPRVESKPVKVKTPPPPKATPRTEQPRQETPTPQRVTPRPAPTPQKQAAPSRKAPPAEKRTKTRSRPR
ncbi:hypothetical protein K8I85_13290 [bacterium]|nr:hypothetical protein [bacterium]